MRLLYSLVMVMFGLIVRIASVRHAKASLWIQGRKSWRRNLRNIRDPNAEYIWVHCASLGEFEQGRPLIERIRNEHPDFRIVLSFYSPSGYEVRKNYDKVDYVCYMPLDTPSNARDFIQILKPRLSVFVKYEVWPNFFLELKKRKLPLVMIAASFRPEQRFFKWYGSVFRRALKACTKIFVQNENSLNLLESIGLDQGERSGDTRFDRVLEIAEMAQPIVLVEAFCSGRKVIVVGSSWEGEVKLCEEVLKGVDDSVCVVIAPHEVEAEKVNALLQRFGDKAIAYSKAVLGELGQKQVLLIDNIGMLSRLYRYADIAIIGGGFGKGLHNCLEAAVYGVPLAFGPNHRNFIEAVELVQSGGAVSTASSKEGSILELSNAVLNLLGDETLRVKMGETCSNYVKSKAGATDQIMNYLKVNHLSVKG